MGFPRCLYLKLCKKGKHETVPFAYANVQVPWADAAKSESSLTEAAVLHWWLVLYKYLKLLVKLILPQAVFCLMMVTVIMQSQDRRIIQVGRELRNAILCSQWYQCKMYFRAAHKSIIKQSKISAFRLGWRQRVSGWVHAMWTGKLWHQEDLRHVNTLSSPAKHPWVEPFYIPQWTSF